MRLKEEGRKEEGRKRGKEKTEKRRMEGGREREQIRDSVQTGDDNVNNRVYDIQPLTWV